MKNGTVPKKLDTSRQALEFGAALLKQAPHLDPYEMQYWIKNQGKLQKALATALGIPDQLREWERFYREVFGKKVDFSNLQLPEKQEGFNWLIVMLEGLTPNKLFAKCQERFTARKYTEDLDTVRSVRTTKKTHVIWVRDRIEADEESKCKSANDCDKEGIKGITLEERLTLELFCRWRIGKHLDINNVTLCSGSRAPSGCVPCVDWSDNEMAVSCCGFGDSGDLLRSRAAVS